MPTNCRSLLRENLNAAVFRVHHFDCTEEMCKTITIDFSNHLMWLTIVISGQVVNRISIDFESYVEIVHWVSEVFKDKKQNEDNTESTF